MVSQKLLNVLIRVGLNENEARMYLSSASLGASSVQKIAATAGVKRTTGYSVLESLKRRGLISIEVKGFKKYYIAAPPYKLESLLEEQRELFSESLDEFESVFNKGGSEAFIQHHEGMESIISVYDSLLKDVKPGDDYLVIGEVRQWFRLAPDYFIDFLKRRSQLAIRVRVLLTSSKPDIEWNASGGGAVRPNEELRVLPAGTTLSTNLVVIPNKVVIQQLVPPVMAMVVENRSLVQMHRETFEILWRSSTPFVP